MFMINQDCFRTPTYCQLSVIFRLQELEDQYRREREEASNLLEQQRLVSSASKPE